MLSSKRCLYSISKLINICSNIFLFISLQRDVELFGHSILVWSDICICSFFLIFRTWRLRIGKCIVVYGECSFQQFFLECHHIFLVFFPETIYALMHSNYYSPLCLTPFGLSTHSFGIDDKCQLFKSNQCANTCQSLHASEINWTFGPMLKCQIRAKLIKNVCIHQHGIHCRIECSLIVKNSARQWNIMAETIIAGARQSFSRSPCTWNYACALCSG